MPGEACDENVSCVVESPILEDFRLYAAELTARHDRHERLIRLSRDVTTESKRVIFFLHSLKSNDIEANLEIAEKRLKVLISGPLKKAAAELQIENTQTVPVPRTLVPAIEELAEAYCLLQYLKTFSIDETPSWKCLQNMFSEVTLQNEPSLIIQPIDFMRGILDFTGELMRMCINNSTANNSIPDSIKILMQNLYIGFIGLRYHRELQNKMNTFKQSLQKVEDTCYSLKLRNTEI